MTKIINRTMKVRELQLADVVRLFEGPWGTGTVIKIDADSVLIYRTYQATADFSYTGGVIPYIGYEHCTYLLSDNRDMFVYERKELK